jgi:protein TonB
MFRETLLESSPASRKRSRWALATAFALQMIAATLLVVISLASTGVIPLNSHTVVIVPTYHPTPDRPPTTAQPGTATGPRLPFSQIVPIQTGPNVITYGHPTSAPEGPVSENPPQLGFGDPHGVPGGGIAFPVPEPVVGPPPKPVVISHLSEALLINRVVPVYPVPAARANIQGEVKLHAIIARDGSIQSLSLISGHPLLASAALEAVRQWKYQPYLLNGQKVEVETWITVNFKRGE